MLARPFLLLGSFGEQFHNTIISETSLKLFDDFQGISVSGAVQNSYQPR
jgi:hypothetical protein